MQQRIPLLLALIAASACDLDSRGNAADAAVHGCVENSDCVVVPQSCCGSCGAATRGDAVAVAQDELNQQRTDACEGMQGCPACFAEPDPLLIASCRANRCELVDLREQDAITSCALASDCQLRFADCCACAPSDTPVIAIRTDADPDFQALTCDSDRACPECAPSFGSSIVAECIANRCEPAFLLRTSP